MLKMDEFDRNYHQKGELVAEIEKQILKGKKVKWFKEKEIEQTD